MAYFMFVSHFFCVLFEWLSLKSISNILWNYSIILLLACWADKNAPAWIRFLFFISYTANYGLVVWCLFLFCGKASDRECIKLKQKSNLFHAKWTQCALIFIFSPPLRNTKKKHLNFSTITSMTACAFLLLLLLWTVICVFAARFMSHFMLMYTRV